MGRGFPYQRVTVLGLGRTGRALVSTLAPRGIEIFLSEARMLAREERGFLSAHKVRFEEGGHTERALDCDLLVPSPGVPSQAPVLAAARRKGIPIRSEVELAYWLARPRKLIAVTGTNGKSTTCEVLGAILRAAGLSPVVAGNIGRAAIGTVDEVTDRPWVLEVSSYQLEWTEGFSPDVAVWLNFAPDHLDHHRTLGAYFAAKARILAHPLTEGAVLSPELLVRLAPHGGALDYTCTDLPQGFGEGLPLPLLLDLKAAWTAASLAFPELSVRPPSYQEIQPAIRQPHRLELVGEFRGITFIDDSKATNAHATAAALQATQGPVVLILGGRYKGAGYEVLEGLLRERVRRCVLIGESRDLLAGLLSAWGIPYERAEGPFDALQRAYAASQPGDVVLLSPACASFDQFRDFAHRGETFRRAFARLSSDRRTVRTCFPEP
jgi:UDP-N-acetylmuramoylalanine--D-glutamate ligase